MSDMLARNWGVVALRGLAAVAFGLLVVVDPGIGLFAMILLFGGYALIDGVLTTISAVRHRREESHWTSQLISGLLGTLIGVLTLLWPDVTAIALVYIIAAWAVIVGLGEIFSAIQLREVITGEWLLILVGSLSVVFGVLLAIFPGAGAVAVAMAIGLFAIVAGILRIALAVRLRRWQQNREATLG